jgi:hypothetical protein
MVLLTPARLRSSIKGIETPMSSRPQLGSESDILRTGIKGIEAPSKTSTAGTGWRARWRGKASKRLPRLRKAEILGDALGLVDVERYLDTL